MDFRARLLATLRALAPVLREPGVLVVGSEVPNLLERDAASTLVISEDVDVALPVSRHAALEPLVREVVGFTASPEEPSVFTPSSPDLIEINYVGYDVDRPGETYVLEGSSLPLMVFGPLSFLEPGPVLSVEGTRVPLPSAASLLLEKLVTDRSGEKGDRDLLVVLGLLLVCGAEQEVSLRRGFERLPEELRRVVQSNLTILSLLEPRAGMPDPTPHRERIARLLADLDAAAGGR